MHPLEYDSPLAAAKGSSITPNNRSSDELCCSHYSAICKDWVAKHNRATRNSTRNCSFKTGSRHQSEKRTILKQFLKAILTGKSQMPNLTNHYRNLDAHTPIRFTTSLSAAKDNSVRKQPHRQTLMQPHCVLQHHTWQTHMYLPIGTDYARNDPGRTRVTHELPSIAGCSHLNTRFRAPASSPTQMPCNIQIHAAITMRFAAARALWCSHYNAICIHALQNTNVFLGTTTAATAATAATAHAHAHPHPHPHPHTRATLLSPAAATLHGKTTRFRAPASSPKQTLCNNHAAITMRFEAARVQPACLDTHGNKTRQQSCSHSTAICKPILRHHHFTTLRHHHSPSAPLPSVTTLVITSLSHHPSFMWCTVKWCKVSQFYLFVTRKIDWFPTSLDKSILILLWSFWGISYISVMRLARVIGVPGFAWKTWPRFFLGNAMINIIQYLSLIWDISQRCLWHHEKQSKADQQKWENNLTWTYCNISKIHEDMTWAPLATMAGHSRVALTWKSFGWTLCKHCAALFSAPNPNSTLEEGCWRRAKIKTITMLTCRCEVGGWWRRVARYKACVCEHLSPLLKTWVFIQQHTAL